MDYLIDCLSYCSPNCPADWMIQLFIEQSTDLRWDWSNDGLTVCMIDWLCQCVLLFIDMFLINWYDLICLECTAVLFRKALFDVETFFDKETSVLETPVVIKVANQVGCFTCYGIDFLSFVFPSYSTSPTIYVGIWSSRCHACGHSKHVIVAINFFG